MNLQELLEELRENILRDASTVVSGPADSLFNDASLVRYINDAEVQFAKQTLCLRDESTPAVCHIQLVAGQAEYGLDPRVIALFGARVVDRHLHRTTYSSMVQRRGDVSFSSSVESWGRNHSGPELVYSDREDGRVGVYPAPSQSFIDATGGLLILRVARKPLNPLVATSLKAEPEVREEYHLDLLEWAAWRALRNNDADVEALAKASAHKKRFLDATAELKAQAKRLLMQEIQFGLSTNWS